MCDCVLARGRGCDTEDPLSVLFREVAFTGDRALIQKHGCCWKDFWHTPTVLAWQQRKKRKADVVGSSRNFTGGGGRLHNWEVCANSIIYHVELFPIRIKKRKCQCINGCLCTWPPIHIVSILCLSLMNTLPSVCPGEEVHGSNLQHSNLYADVCAVLMRTGVEVNVLTPGQPKQLSLSIKQPFMWEKMSLIISQSPANDH